MKNIELNNITPRPYQWEAYLSISNAIRHSADPVVVSASVGAGKTLMMAMIAKRAQDVGMSTLIITRQAELVDQNATMLWRCGVKNSIFCAGLGVKSITFACVVGSEKTVCNALNGKLIDFNPDLLLIDECHHVDMIDLEDGGQSTQYSIIINELKKRNNKLRIIGFTGTPYRGVTPIIGKFWIRKVYDIGTDDLVDMGYLTPTVFGCPVDKYDLREFASTGEDGINDFTAKQMLDMQRKILKNENITKKITEEVIEITKNRNGVLITCAGQKHCDHVAQYLPADSWAIITDKTKDKDRKNYLDYARAGKVKFVLQVGALTTGVDVPYRDTSVILRKIGSLTLLVQLLGRGMRLMSDDMVSRGFAKKDHMVLDYTDTMRELGELYHSPLLERAEFSRGKMLNETKICPKCSEQNGFYSRRCINNINGSRCDWYWSYTECECGTKNDPCARYCRECGATLINPEDGLLNKHYTDDDYLTVKQFNIKLTKSQNGVIFEYVTDKCTARELLYPNGHMPFMRKKYRSIAALHAADKESAKILCRATSPIDVVAHKDLIMAPKKITHRVNNKNNDIISRKIF